MPKSRGEGLQNVLMISHPITSVPDSPHEPDPEPYEPMPPRLIPLDEVSTPKTHAHILSFISFSLIKHILYTCVIPCLLSCQSGLPCRTPPWWMLATLSPWKLHHNRALPWPRTRAPSCRLFWPTSWSTWATAPAARKPQTLSTPLWPPLSTYRSCSHLSW